MVCMKHFELLIEGMNVNTLKLAQNKSKPSVLSTYDRVIERF